MVLSGMLVKFEHGMMNLPTLLCLGLGPSHLSGCPGLHEHVAKCRILNVRC